MTDELNYHNQYIFVIIRNCIKISLIGLLNNSKNTYFAAFRDDILAYPGHIGEGDKSEKWRNKKGKSKKAKRGVTNYTSQKKRGEEKGSGEGK